MSFEIDVLPVGEGARSGDAIALRFGQPGAFRTMIFDGGTLASGEALVTHFRTYYGTNHVDYVVNSHPDNDHCSGLRVVFDEMSVGQFWMHRPWLHAADILHLFQHPNWTVGGLAQRLRDEYPITTELEQAAIAAGVPIFEPFQGCVIGPFLVLSPSVARYRSLVPGFRDTPVAKGIAESEGFFGLLKGAVSALLESWDIETLKEGGETSAENETSVVMAADLDGQRVLLTGDAGHIGLHDALDYAESLGIDLKTLRFLQVPHHGGRRNVSPSLLNRLIGPKLRYGAQPSKVGYVSAAINDEDHPRKSVVNALIRRGTAVFETKGQAKIYFNNLPWRPGWGAAAPLEFSQTVEGE